MLDLMDPSRNMSKYRNLLNSQFVQPPLVRSSWLSNWLCILSLIKRPCLLTSSYDSPSLCWLRSHQRMKYTTWGWPLYFSQITSVFIPSSTLLLNYALCCSVTLQCLQYTILILNFWIDRSGQTVQTQIRLLLVQILGWLQQIFWMSEFLGFLR